LRNPDTFLPLVSAALRGVNSGCLCFCKNICVQIVNMKFSSSFLVSVTRWLLGLWRYLVSITMFRMFLSKNSFEHLA